MKDKILKILEDSFFDASTDEQVADKILALIAENSEDVVGVICFWAAQVG